jgi:hypothetical protein
LKIDDGRVDRFHPFTISIETAEERNALLHAIEEGYSATTGTEDKILLPLTEYMRGRQMAEARAAEARRSRRD